MLNNFCFQLINLLIYFFHIDSCLLVIGFWRRFSSRCSKCCYDGLLNIFWGTVVNHVVYDRIQRLASSNHFAVILGNFFFVRVQCTHIDSSWWCLGRFRHGDRCRRDSLLGNGCWSRWLRCGGRCSRFHSGGTTGPKPR
mmetsp:Transcript_112124/g.323897  ORF Transcript_112124/g.323897 Transcript_112124/m.323897 type:complete len:139 (+) Transcript_112124:449-865(+)